MLKKGVEWVVYALTGVFGGYDDSVASQKVSREFSNFVEVDATKPPTVLDHPSVQYILTLNGVLAALSGAIAFALVSKKEREQEITNQETLAATERSARVSRFERFVAMLDEGGQKDYVLSPDMQSLFTLLQKVKQNDYDEEHLVTELNCVYFRFVIAHYRQNRNKISAFDAHKLRSVLAAITDDDISVRQAYQNFIFAEASNIKNRLDRTENDLVDAVESVMRRRRNLSLKKSKAQKVVEKIQNVGDAAFSGTTGMSIASSYAASLVMVPVVNVIVAAVMLAAGVAAAAIRLVRDFFYEKKSRQRFKKSVNVTTRNMHTQQLAALYDHVLKLDNKPDLAEPLFKPQVSITPPANITADHEDAHLEHKAEFGLGVTTKAIAAGALSIVVGWFTIDTIMKIVTGFGGAAITAGSQAALALPIVGVVIAGALFLSKTALEIYKANKQEQKVITDINAKKSCLRSNLSIDPELRETATLSDSALLRKYVQAFLEVNDAESKELFMQRIEAMILFKRPIVNKEKDFDSGVKLMGYNPAIAKNDDAFYSYLAGKLSDPSAGELSKVDLARSVKLHMTGNNNGTIIATDKMVKASLPARVFRRKFDDPTKHDHRGNFRRFMRVFANTTAFSFTATSSIGIGFALASVVAAGPYFPIVAAAIAAVLVTTFIVSQVLEYRRDKRTEGYNQEIAKMAIQDKAAEYLKLKAQRDNVVVAEPPAPVPAPEPIVEHAPAPEPEPEPEPQQNIATDQPTNVLIGNRRHSFIATQLAEVEIVRTVEDVAAVNLHI